MLKRYIFMAFRLIFAIWYFGVGIIGFATNNAAKNAANAATAFEKALSSWCPW